MGAPFSTPEATPVPTQPPTRESGQKSAHAGRRAPRESRAGSESSSRGGAEKTGEKGRDARSRAVAHRFAGACARSLDDVTAIGVRFDDDDPAYGETLAVRLRPGRMETLGALRGPARAVALLGDAPVVLDGAGALRTLSGDELLRGVVDLHPVADGRLLALVGDDVVDVERQATVARARDAVSVRGGVIRTARGVVDLDGATRVDGAVDVAALSTDAVDARGTLAFVRGKTLTVGPTSLALPFVAHSLVHASFPGAAGAGGAARWFVGSKVGGLAVVEIDQATGTAGVRVLRPSLRAHGLSAVAGPKGGLLIVSDLFVATSDDGVDFASRDLASYVRLAEKQAA